MAFIESRVKVGRASWLGESWRTRVSGVYKIVGWLIDGLLEFGGVCGRTQIMLLCAALIMFICLGFGDSDSIGRQGVRCERLDCAI
jgi:hypothetical protein